MKYTIHLISENEEEEVLIGSYPEYLDMRPTAGTEGEFGYKPLAINADLPKLQVNVEGQVFWAEPDLESIVV